MYYSTFYFEFIPIANLKNNYSNDLLLSLNYLFFVPACSVFFI